MNIRIIALGLMLAAQAVIAQEAGKPAKPQAAERTAMLETLQKGELIKGSGSERYRYLPEVLAVARGARETPQEALARAGGGELLETKGRLVLFRSAQQKPALVESFAGLTVYPTALNTRTGNLGVLTGTLVVQPKSEADAAAIARSHGLETTKEYPQIRFVLYRARAGTDIADATAALQADPRIALAYPEIIEYVRTPK